MCRRPAIEMDPFNAAMDNCALAMREIEASRSTLGAVQAEKRMLQKASRAGQISRPLATMLMRGLDVIQGGTERGRALDEADYRHGLLLTGMCLESRRAAVNGSTVGGLRSR